MSRRLNALPFKYPIRIGNSLEIATPGGIVVRGRIVEYFKKRNYELDEESKDRFLFSRNSKGSFLMLEPYPLNMRSNLVEITWSGNNIITEFTVNTLWLKPWERSYWMNQGKYLIKYVATGVDSNEDFNETLGGALLEGLVDLLIVLIVGLPIIYGLFVLADYLNKAGMSMVNSMLLALAIVVPIFSGSLIFIITVMKKRRI